MKKYAYLLLLCNICMQYFLFAGITLEKHDVKNYTRIFLKNPYNRSVCKISIMFKNTDSPSGFTINASEFYIKLNRYHLENYRNYVLDGLNNTAYVDWNDCEGADYYFWCALRWERPIFEGKYIEMDITTQSFLDDPERDQDSTKTFDLSVEIIPYYPVDTDLFIRRVFEWSEKYSIGMVEIENTSQRVIKAGGIIIVVETLKQWIKVPLYLYVKLMFPGERITIPIDGIENDQIFSVHLIRDESVSIKLIDRENKTKLYDPTLMSNQGEER